MAGSIKNKIGQLIVNSKIRKCQRNRQTINLNNARHIGVLYVLTDNITYKMITAFVSRLQNKGKQVKALGFVKNKKDIQKFLPKLSFDYFSEKDINIWGVPHNNYINDFIKEEFDILIDLSNLESIALKYIAGASAAKMKVGDNRSYSSAFYDIILSKNAKLGLHDHLNNIYHYLEIIKPS